MPNQNTNAATLMKAASIRQNPYQQRVLALLNYDAQPGCPCKNYLFLDRKSTG
jgi:hypothetical protein